MSELWTQRFLQAKHEREAPSSARLELPLGHANRRSLCPAASLLPSGRSPAGAEGAESDGAKAPGAPPRSPAVSRRRRRIDRGRARPRRPSPWRTAATCRARSSPRRRRPRRPPPLRARRRRRDRTRTRSAGGPRTFAPSSWPTATTRALATTARSRTIRGSRATSSSRGRSIRRATSPRRPLDASRSQIVEPTVVACVSDIIKKVQFAPSPGGFETQRVLPVQLPPASRKLNAHTP